MSVITLQMLKDVQSKMVAIPTRTIIVGSPIRFREEMKKRGAKICGTEDEMIFLGVPVKQNNFLDEYTVAVIENGKIISIINLNDEPKEEKI